MRSGSIELGLYFLLGGGIEMERGDGMDIRFTNRWGGFSIKELERMLWMTEYYVNQDDLTFDLGKEIFDEIRRRVTLNELAGEEAGEKEAGEAAESDLAQLGSRGVY